MALAVAIGVQRGLELGDERGERSTGHEHTVPEAKGGLVPVVELGESSEGSVGGSVRSSVRGSVGSGTGRRFAGVALLPERRGGHAGRRGAEPWMGIDE